MTDYRARLVQLEDRLACVECPMCNPDADWSDRVGQALELLMERMEARVAAEQSGHSS